MTAHGDYRSELGAAGVPGTGGDTSNTPPQTSQRAGEGGKAVGGEDWLEWTWGVRWGTRWEEHREKLSRARAAAGANNSGNGEPADLVNMADGIALVSPGGGRLGRGNKGPYMPWRFTCNGMVFMLADRQEPHGNLPSLLVRVDGRACLTAGACRLWQWAQQLVTMLGGRIEWERVSRVDLCLDLPGQSIEPFRLAHLEHRYITRAKGEGYRRMPGMTLYVGSAPPLLRIYDKLAEVTSSGDGVKRALMVWHRWGGFDPSEATRVEFELNREALKSRGVNSVADYFRLRGDLAKYLCTDWVRFTETVPDRTHTTRAKTLRLWEQVTEGFLSWTGKPTNEPLVPLPREACEVERLFRSMLGMTLTAAVQQGESFESEEDLIRYALRGLREELPKVNWRERMRRKSVEYVTETG